MEHYNTIVLGGTFDHFHMGHEAFLQFALDRCDNLIVGLTSEKFSHRKDTTIEPYAARLEHIQTFFARKNVEERVRIVAIDDLYGPTLSEEHIDAIVVSPQTKEGAQLINQKRAERGWSKLKILEIPLVKASDGHSVSSSRIRDGSIAPDGRVFVEPKWREHTLEITPPIREELAKPFGMFIADFHTWIGDSHLRDEQVVTVGDVVTKTCNELGIQQRISVVDFRVEREERFRDKRELGFVGNEMVFTVINPPGTIMSTVWSAIERAKEYRDARVIIKIDGEEDLVVLPLILSLPLGCTIFYGQPHEGVVQVVVDAVSKEKARKTLAAFHVRGATTRGS